MSTNGTPIENLDLSVRAYHILKRFGIDTVEEAKALTINQLGTMRNLGRVTMIEIVCKLTNHEVPERDVAKILMVDYIDVDETVN